MSREESPVTQGDPATALRSRPRSDKTPRILRSQLNQDDMSDVESPLEERSQEPTPTPRSASGWLPYLGPKTPIWTSKAMCSSLIQKRKHRDWFLALASAIDGRGDPTQSKMLSKAYVFLRDFFVPRGLVEGFRHIRGDDVMEQLVCHPPETTVSRHRVARHAEVAWKELEQWMAVGTD
ncbi:hypothetical protein F5883DRAFT_529650 [Diaporthe sp. PMI_573]|nr:hypothetical protein F5883DRAFT_529650 [Diaporthaceae sp. PMI_573]